MIAELLKTSKCSLVPEFKFWSGSLIVTVCFWPGWSWETSESIETEPVNEPERIEYDLELYDTVAVWPRGASFLIPIVDSSLSSKLSKIAEFGSDSTKVIIWENVSVPSETEGLGWLSFVLSSATEPRLPANSPLSSKPKLERNGTRFSKAGVPFAASFPFSSNAW